MCSHQAPDALIDGLAIYKVGSGEPVLLFPYPHGSTQQSMVKSPIAEVLVNLGRNVLTFDPPGSYESTRIPNCSLQEMMECATQTLDFFKVPEAPIVGHSMGGFCALAFACRNSTRVERLVIICGNSSFAAVQKQWSQSKVMGVLDWLKLTLLGTRQILKIDNLQTHKQMNNLLDSHLFVDQQYFHPQTIGAGDAKRPAPIRNKWTSMIREEKLESELSSISVPTLLISGRNDILSSEQNNELMDGLIPESNLVYFESSRHFPFLEEERQFIETLANFL